METPSEPPLIHFFIFFSKIRSIRKKFGEVRSEEVFDGTDPTADLPWSHSGAPAKQQIQQLVMAGTPIFSTFAGTKVEGAKLRRIEPWP